MAKFQELLTPKQKQMIRQSKAKAILTKEGVLLVPKQSRSAKFRNFLSASRRVGIKVVEVGEEAFKEEQKLEKVLKKI